MVRVKFNLLTIMMQRRFKNAGFTKKLNTGLDTETYDGFVKLICDDTGDYKEIESIDDIIKFLTQEKFRGKYNWFYNINFDFQSIIKYLNKEQLIEIYTNNNLVMKWYKITYLSKKFFAITDKQNHRYYFYDLYNFLDTSLDTASKKFLGESKLKIVDAARLNTDLNYWKEKREDIIRYCIQDSKLTKKLADYFWNIIYRHLNYFPKRPFSKGKLSEEYFMSKCYIPTINDLDMHVLQYAYDSYYGGRFELLQKGYFDKVYCYDIKSAYPKQIAELIDFTQGKWKKTNKLNPDLEYGFYNCSINCLEAFFSPFRQKIGELNIYPNGEFKQYMTKGEIDFINDNFEHAEIKILSGWEFYPKEYYYPFKNEVERLYKWKEKEKDSDIKYCVKIILNSLYGKTIQVVGDDNRTGKLFNPLYASLITSGTRIKLMEYALKNPESIISFSTDSITSIEKLQIPRKPKLGDFSFDFEGHGVFIMSDVYNLWNDKNENKNRLRGFAFTKEKDYDDKTILLKDILNAMPFSTIYEYTTSRPYHLGECLLHTHKKDISMLNVFYDVPKSIDINGDNKRIWQSEFRNGKDAMKRMIKSLPLKIGE